MLATASIVMAAASTTIGGSSSLGNLMLQYMQLRRYHQAREVWLTIVGVTLAVDVILGVVQMVVAHIAERRRAGANHPATAKEAT
jgi:heme/copper-type cytochrome/quinol oxidase subunit 2